MPAGDLPGQLSAESDAARIALDSAVEDVLGADAEVERKLVEGDAGEALVAESEAAQLVVVGSHGRSGFKAALLGSVSRHVANHAACPVVVVKTTPAKLATIRPRSGRLQGPCCGYRPLVFSARSRSRSVTPPAVCVHQRTVTFR